MINRIEKRVEALEVDAGRADHNLQVVIAEHGETGEQARQRLGINRDAGNVLVVVFE